MDDARELKRITSEIYGGVVHIQKLLDRKVPKLEKDGIIDTDQLNCLVSNMALMAQWLKEDLHLLNYLKFRMNTEQRKDELNAANGCGENYPGEGERIPEEEHGQLPEDVQGDH